MSYVSPINVLCISYQCSINVLSMSYLSPINVLCIPYQCHMYLLSMFYVYPGNVLSMSYLSPINVLCIPYQCHMYLLSMFYVYPGNVLSMSYLSPINVLCIPYQCHMYLLSMFYVYPNGFPTKILQMISREINSPFNKICNIAIMTETHPDRLKIANLLPVLKKGSRLTIANYRPISLLSNLFTLIFIVPVSTLVPIPILAKSIGSFPRLLSLSTVLATYPRLCLRLSALSFSYSPYRIRTSCQFSRKTDNFNLLMTS